MKHLFCTVLLVLIVALSSCKAGLKADKSVLAVDNICDSQDVIYAVHEQSIYEIDKSTLVCTNTGNAARSISCIGGKLYSLDDGVYCGGKLKYPTDNIADSNFYDCISVSSKRIWLTASILAKTAVKNISDSDKSWKYVNDCFPIIDNCGNEYIAARSEENGILSYTVGDVLIYQDEANLLVYNDRFHCYNGYIYTLGSDSAVVSVSLKDGSIVRIEDDVDTIVSVGHGTLYYTADGKLYKRPLSGDEAQVCSNYTEQDNVFVDSYRDVVYLIEFGEKSISCRSAEFD